MIKEIVERAPDALLVADEGGIVLLANRQAEKMFGFDRSELVGATIEDLVPERFREAHQAHRAEFRADPRTRGMGSGLILHARRRDDSEFTVEISLSPVQAGTDQYTIAAVRDVTDRVAAEEVLHRAAQELSVLQDRERIARDLHDTVIQRLFAAGMALQSVAAVVQGDAEASVRIERVIDDLDEAIRDLRTAIHGLQPRTERRVGLRHAILRVLGDQRPALPSEPRVRFVGALDAVPEPVTRVLLPVLQELLANVGRHAGATTVDVQVDASGGEIALIVTDDGVGFDPGSPRWERTGQPRHPRGSARRNVRRSSHDPRVGRSRCGVSRPRTPEHQRGRGRSSAAKTAACVRRSMPSFDSRFDT